jgi:2,5-diamino-6-(ribosylamino)-4(3H)-pyrimidinone 5'-phosphate reductase
MKPRVILYNAVSVDGRTTGFSVDIGLFYSLVQQWGEDATLAGCDTLLNAPHEMPEDEGSEVAAITPSADDSRPILVVPDSRGRIKSWHYWRGQPYWKGFVSLCTERTSPEHLEYLKQKGIQTLTAGTEYVDYKQALEELSSQFGIGTVRVDSGGTLNGVLLREGLVDEVHLLVHPALVGETSQKTFFRDTIAGQTGEIALRFNGSELHSEGILLLSYAVVR